MSYGSPDVYYQPEKFDLTLVAEIDYSDGSYCFDIRAIWKHKDGTLYTGRDSGCSCPGIFETTTSLADLEKLDISSLEAEIVQELESESRSINPEEAEQFLAKVRAA